MIRPREIVYFLGAGATKADFPAAPLGDELLHAILSQGEFSVLRSLLERLFDAQSLQRDAPQNLRPRLDDVFTLLESSINGRAPIPLGMTLEDVISCRSLLIAAIAKTIERVLGQARGPLAVRFAQFLRDTPQIVVSTNYDVVMDNALFECDNLNYGVTVRSAVGRSGAVPEGRPDERRYYRADPRYDHLVRKGHVPLLKLHGSLNWLSCPRCDELDVTLLEKGTAEILTFPELGRCGFGFCTARYQALLVGPSLEQRYENRILREVWTQAELALSRAERLIVVGYSLPEADYLIRAMLARHFSKRSEGVLVVSRGESGTVDPPLETRYRRLFPRCKFRMDGFEGYVVDLASARGLAEG